MQYRLRTPVCDKERSAYRAAFAIDSGRWANVRLPWNAFEGQGKEAEENFFVPSIRRLGIIATGDNKDVELAVGKVGFYTDV